MSAEAMKHVVRCPACGVANQVDAEQLHQGLALLG